LLNHREAIRGFAYIARRVVYGVVTLFALSLVVFVLIQFSGGTPLDR
jgi:ABC-type microcin C transport system permease subunit YejB